MWRYYSHTTDEGPASETEEYNDNTKHKKQRPIVNCRLIAWHNTLAISFCVNFTQDKIANYFSRVWYVPFTRNFLKITYICHEIGE